MRITFFPMVAMILTTFLHILLSLLFVKYLDYGVIGLAMAVSIKDFVLYALTTIYCMLTDNIAEVMVPYDKEALRGWKEYLSISIPAAVMICAEYYAFEFITVAAGTLGIIELASITVVYSYSTLLFMIALGIQEGTCTLIGNCIGANNVPLAKRFYHMIAKFTSVVVVILSLVTLIARKPIVALFTHEPNVQEMVENLFILVAIMKLVDSFQCYLQGPIRAMGLQ